MLRQFFWFLLVFNLKFACIFCNFAYVTNAWDDTVSVIDTISNTVVDTINVGDYPYGLAITPNNNLVYVVNTSDDTVNVIDTSSNTVVNTIAVGDGPLGIAITPGGNLAYVTN